MPILADGTQAWSEIDAIISHGNSQAIEIPVYTYDAGGYMPSGGSGDYGEPQSFESDSYNWPTTDSVFGVPSHASGLEFVPYDNYLAKLHKGERILTAEENRKITGLVTVQYAPVISIGANVAREEIKIMLDEQLYEHSQAIEKMIVNKIKGNR